MGSLVERFYARRPVAQSRGTRWGNVRFADENKHLRGARRCSTSARARFTATRPFSSRYDRQLRFSLDFCELGHFVFRIIGAKDFRVGGQDEFSTVPMSLPFRDELVIHTRLPQPTNEHLADVALGEMLESHPAARPGQCLLGILHSKQLLFGRRIGS